MNSAQRIELIISEIKLDSILIIEGRLKSTEEALLIRRTMSEFSDLEGKDDEFSGIEIATLFDNEELSKVDRKSTRLNSSH